MPANAMSKLLPATVPASAELLVAVLPIAPGQDGSVIMAVPLPFHFTTQPSGMGPQIADPSRYTSARLELLHASNV